MADESPDIDGGATALDGIEVLGERCEGPFFPEPLAQGRDRHPLDVLEGADDRLTVLGPGGGHREAAVAHHHGRHPVPGRDGEHAVPHDLGVVVGVNVDEPGAHHPPRRVDRLRRAAPRLSDGGDPSVADANLALVAGVSRAVHDKAVDDLEVEVVSTVPGRHGESPMMVGRPGPGRGRNAGHGPHAPPPGVEQTLEKD